MNKVPTILFQEKHAGGLGEAIKAIPNIIKQINPAQAATALATAGGLDFIQHKGDYSNIDATRIGIGLFNAGLGGMGAHYFAKGSPLVGAELIALAPVKDVAFAAAPAAIQWTKTQKAIEEQTRKSFLEKLSPTEKAILLAAGTGLSALAIPALMNLSNAAKRVGDGRSIRVSSSIRKRPNQDSDLTINVRNQNMANPGERTLNEQGQIQSSLPQEQKGLLSRIFNF